MNLKSVNKSQYDTSLKLNVATNQAVFEVGSCFNLRDIIGVDKISQVHNHLSGRNGKHLDVSGIVSGVRVDKVLRCQPCTR